VASEPVSDTNEIAREPDYLDLAASTVVSVPVADANDIASEPQ